MENTSGPKTGTFEPPHYSKYKEPNIAELLEEQFKNDEKYKQTLLQKIKIYRNTLYSYIEENKLNPNCETYVNLFLQVLKDLE